MTIDQLENLTIYEIRKVARRAGLVPGTKRKSEIIKEIIAVNEGKLTPATDKKFGRPPKSVGLADLFFTPSQDNTFYGGTITLNQTPSTFKYGDVLEVLGYLEIKKGGGVLWEQEHNHFNKYAVPLLVLESYNLKQGDKIFASASSTPDGSIIKEIFRINDVKADQQPKQRINYDKTNHTEPTNAIENNQNLNLKFGETYFVSGDNCKNNTSAIINFINGCKADYKLYVNNMLADKNSYLINNLDENVEQFVVNMADDPNTSKTITMLAIERAKRLFELGKTCILVLDNLNSLLGLDENGQLARNLLNLTKNSNKGAITVVAVAEENKYTMPYMSIADKKFKVENDNLV